MTARAKFADRERLGSDYVPYVRHADDETVVLEGRALLSIIEVDGLAFETADMSRVNGYHFALNTLLRNVADEAVTLTMVMLRRRVQEYPAGGSGSGFVQGLEDRYRDALNGAQLYRNRLLVCVLRQPGVDPLEKGRTVFGLVKKARKDGIEIDAEHVKKHRDTVLQLATALENVNSAVLGLVERDGVVFTQIGHALHTMVGGRQTRVPLTLGLLSSGVYQDRIVFGRETLEIRYEDQSRFGGVYGVKEYPAATNPLMTADLLSVPFEMMLSQSFRFISKGEARDIAERKAAQLVNVNDRAVDQVDDLVDAIGDLESNSFVLGEHQMTAVVWAGSVKQLGDHMARVRSSLTVGGAVVVREDMGLEAAFWACLPGNRRFQARSGHVSSRNFAALAPLHGFPAGKAAGNQWGPAVTMFKTSAGSPYHFNCHRQDVGHTFVCGPSGSGKTVLMNFLLANLMKFGPRMIVVDKDRGCELFVRACGGRYLALKNGVPTGFAPLKALPVEGASGVWLGRWIEWVVGGTITTKERQDLAAAIASLAIIPVEQRSIRTLRAYLDVTDPNGVSARLAPWEAGGPLGWVFDGEQDEIKFDRQLVGFDMTEFLSNDVIRGPMMSYLFYRIRELLNGERLVIAIDEFWRALRDEGFREFIEDGLKTMRKQNGFFIFATQSPVDALKSTISHTIIDQCVTQIYMPNGRAQEVHYIEGMKLTEREFALVQKEMGDNSRQFLIRQGGASVVAELNLNGFDDELTILSGRASGIELLETIREEAGDDPNVWLPLFYQRSKAS